MSLTFNYKATHPGVFAHILAMCVTVWCLAACQNPNRPNTERADHTQVLSDISLNPGFKISVYADELKQPKYLAVSPEGLVFVNQQNDNGILVLHDENADNFAEQSYPIGLSFKAPEVFTFHEKNLYVVVDQQIFVFRHISDNFKDNPNPAIFMKNLPIPPGSEVKRARFGPDNHLYLTIRSNCDNCQPGDSIAATISRIRMPEKHFEIVHKGVRESWGMDWDPVYENLWFTDRGRYEEGKSYAADELNWASDDGFHFGYPFCHGYNMPNDHMTPIPACGEYRPPIKTLGPYRAPAGMMFYTHTTFPPEFYGQLFICETGNSQSLTQNPGRISLVRLGKGAVVSYEPFVKFGSTINPNPGRPFDMASTPDGAILISDDISGLIYRIEYQPK